MGFSYFHEIVILSGMNIFSSDKTDIVKGCGFWNGKIILIWYLFFFNQQIMILEDENNIYLILYIFYTALKI